MGVLTTDRNSKGRGEELFRFTQGIDVDSKLASQEIRVQKAWARALGNAGVLSGEEAVQVSRALDEAQAAIESGTFEWRIQDEDVHMNLERFVTEKAGALGKKMHTGRSRNDLIATTLRLFVSDSLGEIEGKIRVLIRSLVSRAEKDMDVLVPGLTHVQHGQPVRHGHVLAAHGWAFLRDLERIRQAAARAKAEMPLGAAALSGTTLALDFRAIAGELGFQSPCANSYDAVGDRDFILEALDAFAQCAVHLSRLSEDCILWASTAIGLVRLPPAWSTGSSIMPNKRNPDVPELTRGKSAHIIAAATNAHALMKAVPTSYGSDLHELKGVYMKSLAELEACLGIFPHFIAGLEPDRKRARELLDQGHILATEAADELARLSVPFREAYAQVAALVEKAESRGIQLQRLPEQDWRELAPKLTRQFVLGLSAESAVERRKSPGGTSLESATQGLRELSRRASPS